MATTTDTLTATTPAPDVTLPLTTQHTYTCSDCVTPTPATEVHILDNVDACAYCPDCARTFRAVAEHVLPAQVAHRFGVVVTL
jgi:hypothetical protein